MSYRILIEKGSCLYIIRYLLLGLLDICIIVCSLNVTRLYSYGANAVEDPFS